MRVEFQLKRYPPHPQELNLWKRFQELDINRESMKKGIVSPVILFMAMAQKNVEIKKVLEQYQSRLCIAKFNVGALNQKCNFVLSVKMLSDGHFMT